jgi:rhomboid protease GluP
VNESFFTTEIDTGDTNPRQWMGIVPVAARNIGWQPIDAPQGQMNFLVPGKGESYGEEVHLELKGEAIIFTSQATNEYYWPENRNEANARRLTRAVAAIREKQRKESTNLFAVQMEDYGALLPSARHLVTPMLIYVNTLLLLLMVAAGASPIDPSVKSLLSWGGNARFYTAEGDWWRLLTHMFLHGGVVHLVGNVFALLYVGMFLEPLIGKLRYAVAYVLAGICGGLASLYMHPHGVGVGASGAIFGLYGVFLAILSTGHVQNKAMRQTMLRSILFFVVFNLLYGLQGNTDNAAHMGGLVSGLAIGYAYYPGLAREHSVTKQIIVSSLAIGLVGLLAFLAIGRM